MVKKIDSQALGILNKSLGLTGAGSPLTELTDGVVDQVVSVNEIVRRGRTQAATGGLYTGVLRCDHTDAETISASIRPYNIPTGAIAPWPVPVPPEFDIWLLGATCLRPSGGGGLTARLTLDWPIQGFGIDDSGAAVVVADPFTLAHWNAALAISGVFGMLAAGGGSGQSYKPLKMRLPRSPLTQLTFASISTVTNITDCQLMLGIFPVALGQDGIL